VHWCSRQSIKDKRNFSTLNSNTQSISEAKENISLNYVIGKKLQMNLISAINLFLLTKRKETLLQNQLLAQIVENVFGVSFILILYDKQELVNYNLTFCRSKLFFVLTFSCETYLDCNVV